MDPEERTATDSNDEPARKRLRPDAAASSDTNPEEIVGITEFIANHEGFDGIIKYRYSDFLVNEISAEGNVVHLTDLSCPDYNKNKSNPSTKVSLSDEVIEQLKNLSTTRSTDRVVIPVDNLSKEERTSIHHFVRSIDMNLKSELVNGSIEVIYQSLANQSRRSNEQWPDKSKPYLKFVLYKENRDTMDAIQSISSCVNLNPSLFQYAGIKDKRGKTCQEITIHKVLPARFKNVNQRLSNIKLGNFQLCENQLRLGQLQGNRFEIFIRNISPSSSELINNYVQTWAEKGFINYFGLQRFGSRTLATQTVGKYLLQHDWAKAIDAILAYDPSIKHDWLRELLQKWNETRDIETVLEGSPYYRRSLELDLLRGLQKHGPKNYINALSSIPRNTRFLYLHAYQSMIWNRIVSRRLQTYGNVVLIGDLYIKDTNNDQQVDYVTESNRHDIQLEQIVLPLPGYDIKYPSNELHSWYRQLLRDDQIDIDQMKCDMKDYSLPGHYRAFIVRASQVEHRLVHYDHITDDFLHSDYDRLINRQTNVVVSANRYTGLILAFSLPKSSYATMALRELLHRNESKLQQNHQENSSVNSTENDNDETIDDVIV